LGNISVAARKLAGLAKILGICELPHIQAARNLRRYRPTQCDLEGCKMPAWIIAVVVAIGLVWSVAAMSNLVPVAAG